MPRKPASAAAQTARGLRGQVETVAAPIGGWNARDPIAKMRATDAVALENWYPTVSDCTIRGGALSYATGFAKEVKTLMNYSPVSGANKFYGATNDGIFDISATGAIGAAVAVATEGYWNWFEFGTSGAHYLMMFNGVDKPIYFDGAAWIHVDAISVPAITGVTTTNLITGNIFKRRLFVIEKSKLSFWYLPVDVAGGAAVEFTLQPLCRKGGYLMAMGTWTVDSGTGPDDYAVFISSEGEVVVFAGTDPGSASAWSLVGVYDLGAKPLGRKCFIKFGGDLLLETNVGVLPLAKFLQSSAINFTLALTDKISNAYKQQAAETGTVAGWTAVILPSQSAILFNVPIVASSQYEQFVMNTITKSWCRFTGWNARDLGIFNGELYYANGTSVAKAWTGAADFGANVVALAQQAYNYFGIDGPKQWPMLRPNFLVDGALQFSFALAVDFKTVGTLAVISYPATSGGVWDVDTWDNAVWAGDQELQQAWETPAAYTGYCSSIVMQVATKVLAVSWVSTDYLIKRAMGVMG